MVHRIGHVGAGVRSDESGRGRNAQLRMRQLGRCSGQHYGCNTFGAYELGEDLITGEGAGHKPTILRRREPCGSLRPSPRSRSNRKRGVTSHEYLFARCSGLARKTPRSRIAFFYCSQAHIDLVAGACTGNAPETKLRFQGLLPEGA